MKKPFPYRLYTTLKVFYKVLDIPAYTVNLYEVFSIYPPLGRIVYFSTRKIGVNDLPALV